jgi:hypothetical protein
MRSVRGAVAGLMFLAAIGIACAAEHPDKPADQNYVIFRITTDLQRDVLFSKETRNYVVVNGDAIVASDGSVRAKALDVQRLYLQLIEGSFAPEETSVSMQVLYSKWPPGQGMDMLEYCLIGVGHGPFQKGKFKEISVCSVREAKDAWKGVLAAAKEDSLPGVAGTEPCLRESSFAVYPVQTPLSRWTTQGCDCVVLIGDRQGNAPEPKDIAGLEKPLGDALEKLKVNRSKLRLQYGRRPRDKDEEKRFFAANEKLANKLGFRCHYVVGH